MKKPQNSTHTHTHTHTHTQIVLAGLIYSIFNFGAYADGTPDLTTQIQNTKNACSGISDRMSDMKRMAGINTAVTGVGTVAGGVGLGTGMLKQYVDNTIEEWERTLDKIIKDQQNSGVVYRRIDPSELNKSFDDYKRSDESLRSDIAEATKTSKKLGNIRTGAMAGAAVADTAGAIIAANNRVQDDLQSQIELCISETNKLSEAYSVAITDGNVDIPTLQKVDKITRACGDWKNVDISKINNRATGAAVSGGAGAILALAGTATSASANSDKVRNDNTDSGKQKEKNLNTASNVLAGGASVASLTATVFNATQISAIKKAATVADKCEEALR